MAVVSVEDVEGDWTILEGWAKHIPVLITFSLLRGSDGKPIAIATIEKNLTPH